MKSEHTAAFNAFKWLQRGLHRVKDLEIFWILHAALIITEAGLTPHIPVGRTSSFRVFITILNT